jgi:HECT-domain (ubiquitin-transferase)
VQVARDRVFDESYAQLKHLTAERWKGQMGVEFVDEQGIDEGGLTKEWFILISQEIFNPDRALFLQSNAGTTYYPNPMSSIQHEHISLFKFIGRIVGKALYEQQLLDCYFVKALYKIILGMPLTYHDVEDFDNDVYRNLKWCLDNSVEGLGLTFSETQDFFGETKEIEIIPGGKDIEVTDENKYDYV